MNLDTPHSKGLHLFTNAANLRVIDMFAPMTGSNGRSCTGLMYISQHAIHAGNHVTTSK